MAPYQTFNLQNITDKIHSRYVKVSQARCLKANELQKEDIMKLRGALNKDMKKGKFLEKRIRIKYKS